MIEIISKVLTYAFVVIIYIFILSIIKLIYSDIRVMSRKKAGLPAAEAYLKPINFPYKAGFKIQESYPLSDNISIGRGKDCGIFINDPYLSHEHAKIFKEDNGYFLEDMGSTNGTKLNGAPVDEEAVELLDGDKIEIGQISFVFLKPELKNGEVTL
ncbi:MAG: FHA domain-containing protein [Bacillota bacterium]|nr:FHA domain-containing protein [Bacillota bacterium]